MKLSALRTMIMVALLAVGAGLSTRAFAQSQNPPDALDMSRVRFQIVDATFVTKLDATNAQFAETSPEKYHGMVVTIRISKPAGEPLKMACQDIVLHYRFGEKSDVARCYGMSTYSAQQDVDRAMTLYSQGNMSSTTGLASTKSATVYLDVFFQYMEPETRDLHLFIAQPVGASYQTGGWHK